MKIYSPKKNVIISQGYGIEGTKLNMLAFYKSIGLKAHNGVDFLLFHGNPVYYIASNRGTVHKICNDPRFGVGITIVDEDNFRHRFWHGVQGSIKVQVGQIVESGDLLMYADNTGASTGDHLHYDLAEVDNNWNVLNGNNGYFGCIDPNPHFVNIFVKDYIASLKVQVSLWQKMIEIWKQIKLLIK